MAEQILFKTIAVEWLKEKQKLVKLSTYCAYALIIHKHLIPAFQNIDFIKEDEVQEFVFRKFKEGHKHKTVHDIVAVLKAIEKYSAKHYLTPIPDWDIKMPSTTEIKKLPTLSLSEHKRLLSFISNNPDYHNIGILISLCTGMRIGEVCGLRWADVSLSRRVITVNRTAGRIYDIEKKCTRNILSTPKTKNSNREIPISPILFKALSCIKQSSYGEYVVGEGNKACDPRNYREYFKRLLKKQGMTQIVFHGLRHTFATRCIESQCDYKTVSVLLGHSNVTTTLNLYVHPNMEQKKRCLSKLNRYLGNLEEE